MLFYLLDHFVKPLIIIIHKYRVTKAFYNQTVVYTYASIAQEPEVAVQEVLYNHSVTSIMQRRYGQHFKTEIEKGIKLRLKYLSAAYIFSSISTANTSHLNTTRQHYMKGIEHVVSTLKLSEIAEMFNITNINLLQFNLVQLSMEYMNLSEDLISDVYNSTTAEITGVANLTILNINAKYGNVTSKTLKELWRLAYFETNVFFKSPWDIYTLSGKAIQVWTDIKTVIQDYTTKTVNDFNVFFQENFKPKYLSSLVTTMTRTATISFSNMSVSSGLSLDQVLRLSIMDLALLIEKGNYI